VPSADKFFVPPWAAIYSTLKVLMSLYERTNKNYNTVVFFYIGKCTASIFPPTNTAFFQAGIIVIG
jgi:hypothetical protein